MVILNSSMEEILAGVFGFVATVFTVLFGGMFLLFVARLFVQYIFFVQNLKKKHARAFLAIKLPPSNEKKEVAMEEFLRSLHRVLPNDTIFSLEMASTDQFLQFHIVIPKDYKNVLESQLYAQYPDAEIEEQEQDYLADLQNSAAVAEFKFKKFSAYPFNTYHNLEEGILKTLSSVLSKTDPGEKVFMQLALKRIGSKPWHRGYYATYKNMFGSKYMADDKPTAAHYKLSQDLYAGKFRIAYVAKDKASSKAKLKTLLGVFKSTKGHYNELKKEKVFITPDLPKAFVARSFAVGDLWTPAELATIFHFPYQGTIVSNVSHTISKRAPGPDILPREGLVDPKDVSFFGKTNYRNDNKIFGVKRDDRRRHMYVIGKTGSGKSRLLQLLLMSDLQQGKGCCLIDPHGDLATDLLRYVPKERIKDVVYINPTDRDFPIGFNPLEPVKDYQIRQHITTFFISIFKKLFAGSWNQRMEHLLRYIVLALLETPDSNVLGIMRMLADTAYRQRVIKQIEDPVVKSFWTSEFSASNEQFMDVAAIPIMNKVGQFIANPVVRNMVGQTKNMIDFERFMNEGKIVFINLSKGKLGDENMALLGSMFITKIQQAALLRAKLPEEERRDFYFYIDEFQNFATDAFSTILSEARKYRLDLTIAHQYIAQLPDEVKATAFGNVGTMVAFSMGADDALYLAKEFSPTFSPDDMINLSTREMYIKMSIDGKLALPFSGRTIDVPPSPFDYTQEILQSSRAIYARDRVEVEKEIISWSKNDSLDIPKTVEAEQVLQSQPQENQQAKQSPKGEEDDGFPEPII